MATRQTDRKSPSFIEQARRAQIVDAAIDTILELGFARASLAEIAKRAGISKGVISYHFAGKDDLVEQVVQEVYTRGAFAMVPAMAVETTAAGVLRAYIRGNIAYVLQHQREMRALIEIFTNYRRPDGSPRYDTRDDDPNILGVQEMLRIGQDSGEFREFDPTIVAMAIRAAIDILPPRHEHHPEMQADQVADELAGLFLAGIQVQDPPAQPRVDVQARMSELGKLLMAAADEKLRERIASLEQQRPPLER